MSQKNAEGDERNCSNVLVSQGDVGQSVIVYYSGRELEYGVDQNGTSYVCIPRGMRMIVFDQGPSI